MKIKLKKFKDLISKEGVFSDGNWIESKDQNPDGSVRLIQLADIGVGKFIDKSNRFMTEDRANDLNCTYLVEGDILVARMPDPIGRACIFPQLEQKCVTVVDICIVRPASDEIDSRWLMHLINSKQFNNQVLQYVTGTTRQRISRGNLAKLDVEVPPLAEQKRIAAILDKADVIRRKRQQAIQLADDFLRSVFLDMFGDPVTNPKGWDSKTIEQLADKEKYSIKAGPFGSALKKADYVPDGYKIYGQEQVIKDDINFGDYYIDEDKYYSLKSCAVSSGDMLISLVGSFGKILVVPDVFEPGIINPRLMKVKFDEQLISPLFMKFMLTTKEMLRKIESMSHGGTMGILNVGKVKSLKVIAPPLKVQQQFMNILSAVNNSKAKFNIAVEEPLFDSLSQKAFAGEL